MSARETRDAVNQIRHLAKAFDIASAAYPIFGAETVSYSRGWWTTSGGMKYRTAELEIQILRLIDRAEAADFIAAHDLGRTPESGIERLKWLSTHCPKLCSIIDSECDEVEF